MRHEGAIAVRATLVGTPQLPCRVRDSWLACATNHLLPLQRRARQAVLQAPMRQQFGQSAGVEARLHACNTRQTIRLHPAGTVCTLPALELL